MQNQKTILFTHFRSNANRDKEGCLIDLLNNLDLKAYRPVVWCNSPILARDIKQLGIKVFLTDYPMVFNGFKFMAKLKSYSKMISEGLQIVDDEQVKLIHINNGASSQWLHIIARIKNLPLLSHLHSRHSIKERATLGLIYPSVTVGISESIVEQMKSDHIPEKRLRVIPDGIDFVRHEKAPIRDIRKELNLPKKSTVIMTAASLNHRKGIDLAISAIYFLHKTHKNVHLVITGEGKDKAYFKNMVNNFNIRNNVHFMGETSNMSSLLKGGVDIFLSAAREEFFDTVLAKANLSGIPVVATDVYGISEVVEHLSSGILVDEENSIAISEALLTLIDNKNLRQVLGQSGKENIIKNYNIETSVAQFQETYQSLINDNSTHLNWLSPWYIKNQLWMLFKGYKSFRHAKKAQRNNARHKVTKFNYRSLQRKVAPIV